MLHYSNTAQNNTAQNKYPYLDICSTDTSLQIEEMQEDATIIEEYSFRKSETDLKSELLARHGRLCP